MVNANELRIGNWVGSDGYKTVKQIHSRYIQFQDDSDYVVFPIALTHIQPIPLTPEILEKCGFVYTPAYKYHDGSEGERWVKGIYLISLMYFSASVSGYGLEWIMAGSQSSAGVLIKSLHQLQNLYFALTGEELNVQL